MFSCTMELPNESVSLDVIFVLFCFHLGRVCDLIFSPKIPEKLLFIFIRGIQQATSISFFFSFLGINEGIKRKHILHSLVADQSAGFLARSRVPPQRINNREIGRTCQQKWKIQHQNQDDHDFLITYQNETSSTTRLIILVFLNALEHQSSSSQNLTRKSSTVNKFLSSNVRTTYLQGG